MRRITAFIIFTLLSINGSAALDRASGKKGILPGASAKDPLDIDAGKLEFFDAEQKLVYTGSVIVKNGPSTLKSSGLIIFLDPKAASAASTNGTSSQRVNHVEADGPVTLVTPDAIYTGDHATYDKKSNKVFLKGHVTLTQGETVVKGDTMEYDLNTSQGQVHSAGQQGSRVKSIFTPGSQQK